MESVMNEKDCFHLKMRADTQTVGRMECVCAVQMSFEHLTALPHCFTESWV